MASLRVDGNDFPAVYAASRWSRRACVRSNLGPDADRMGDLPGCATRPRMTRGKYRAPMTGRFPLGDPIARLGQHLTLRGLWSRRARHQARYAGLEAEECPRRRGCRGLRRRPMAYPQHCLVLLLLLLLLFEGVYRTCRRTANAAPTALALEVTRKESGNMSSVQANRARSRR